MRKYKKKEKEKTTAISSAIADGPHLVTCSHGIYLCSSAALNTL